jgi:hypothetical protein
MPFCDGWDAYNEQIVTDGMQRVTDRMQIVTVGMHSL